MTERPGRPAYHRAAHVPLPPHPPRLALPPFVRHRVAARRRRGGARLVRPAPEAHRHRGAEQHHRSAAAPDGSAGDGGISGHVGTPRPAAAGGRRAPVAPGHPVHQRDPGAGRPAVRPRGRHRRPARAGHPPHPRRFHPPGRREPGEWPGNHHRLPPRQLGRHPGPREGQDQQRHRARWARPPRRDRPADHGPARRLLRAHRVRGPRRHGRRAPRRRRTRRPAHGRRPVRGPVRVGLAPFRWRPGAGVRPQPQGHRARRLQPFAEPGSADGGGPVQDAGRGRRRRRDRWVGRRPAPPRRSRHAPRPAPALGGAGPGPRPGAALEHRGAGKRGAGGTPVGGVHQPPGRRPVRRRA